MSDACFDDEILVDLAEGRGTMNASAEAHLGVCSNCRRAFAAVARGRGEVFREEPRLESLEGEEPGWDEIGHGVVVGARYVLDAFLGAGGMGIVWRARRADDGASVALKIARSGDLDSCRRFEREARVLAALDHPHIVRIYETLAPTENRGPVIVQELLSGESLEARLERVVTLSLGETSRIVMAVASALRASHAGGIVHRDLKPANVFVTATGRVVVLDFGIAKLMPEWGTHTKLTRTGAVVGSPRYMAPEQLYGEPSDARADVWSLGALLFRALAGRGPLETGGGGGGGIGDMMKALQQGVVPDLAAFAPALPADVLAVTRAALTVDSAQRFFDISHFETVFAQHVPT